MRKVEGVLSDCAIALCIYNESFSGCHSVAKLSSLFSKETTHSSQYTVLLRVIRVLFAWNFQDCRECGGIGIDAVSYTVGNLTIRQQKVQIRINAEYKHVG